MIFSLTIAGVPKLLKAGTFVLGETANRRCTASFRIDSLDRSYRPAEGAEVIIEEDNVGGSPGSPVRKFGGLIDSPTERGFGGPLHPGISTTINAVDFQVYAERRFVKLTLAAGTLKSQLQTLVTTYLATYSVTLDGGQVNGPAMPELVYDKYTRFDVVINEMMTLTADAGQPFIFEIDYFKVARAYQPSTEPAPFDLIGNDLPEVVGDIEVETSRSLQYANRVIVQLTPKEERGRIESFAGDGTAGPFTLQYTPTTLYGHILVLSGGAETLGPTGTFDSDGNPVQWWHDSVTNSITRNAGNTSVGETYNLYFDGTFSGSWIAEDAGEIASIGVWERVVVLDSIPNDTTGQAFADAELAKRITPIKTVKYTTWEPGLEIGQQQTINVSSRNVNAAAVIVDISTRDLVHRLERKVTAVIDATQTNIGRSFQDDYEIWYGDKSGAAAGATVGDGGPASSGPAPPFKSVQFNRSGAFGGDGDFTYNEGTNSITCGGGGSAITAADHESCFVFGHNCHIRN